MERDISVRCIARLVVLCVVLSLGGASSAQAQTFTATSTPYPVGPGPIDVAIGGLDGDGVPDVATADNDNAISLLTNDGSGALTATGLLNGASNSQFALGDLNGDGRADVAKAGNNVALYLSPEYGVTDLASSAGTVRVAIGDFDGDGLRDVAALRPTAKTLSLYMREADNSGFGTTPTMLSTGSKPTALAVGDLNADGRLDFVVSNFNGTLSRFVNDGSGGYDTSTVVPGGTAIAKAVAIGDLNGDGRADLALARITGGTSSRGALTLLLKNASDDEYTTAAPVFVGTGATQVGDAVVISDFNGDGRPDLATNDQTDNAVAILLKDATGDGYAETLIPAGKTPTRLAVGNLAGAGKIDLVATSSPDSTATVIVNTTPQATAVAMDGPAGASSGFGDSVAFPVSVAPIVTGLRGEKAPGGSVTFSVDGHDLSPVAVAGGVAQLSTQALGVGTHNVSAVYSGDANFASGSVPVRSHVVTAASTVTGEHAGDLVVSGSTSLVDAHVSGSVTVQPGATLDMERSTVDGGLSSVGAGGLRVCDSRVTGSVSVGDAAGLVVIGDEASARCAINTIVGELSLTNNAHGVRAISNQVGGAVTDTANTGPGPFPGDPSSVSGNAARPVVKTSAAPVFADTVVGTAGDPQTVTVSNTGLATLHVASVAFSPAGADEFVVSDDACASTTVARGASCTLKVALHPTTAGAHTATLRVVSDAASSPDEIALSAVAVMPAHVVLPAADAFADTVVGASSAAKSLTFTNDGGAPLHVGLVELVGVDAVHFAKGSDGCANTTLAPAAQCTVDVTFSPLLAGAHSASLQLTSDAASSPDVVALSGTGVAPPPPPPPPRRRRRPRPRPRRRPRHHRHRRRPLS